MLLIFIGVQVLPAAMYNYTKLEMALFGQGQDFLLQVFRLFLVTVVILVTNPTLWGNVKPMN